MSNFWDDPFADLTDAEREAETARLRALPAEAVLAEMLAHTRAAARWGPWRLPPDFLLLNAMITKRVGFHYSKKPIGGRIGYQLQILDLGLWWYR